MNYQEREKERKNIEKQAPYAQFPKALIDLPISNDAKLLYTLLKDRYRLSVQNNYVDEKGIPFCCFSNREICRKVHCAHGKATALLQELERAGMIFRLRRGRGRTDRIYVGDIPEPEEVRRLSADNCADFSSESVPISGSQVCRFSAPSKNKENNHLIETEESKERLSSVLKQLELSSLYSARTKSALVQIVWHVTTVMTAPVLAFRVGTQDVPAEEVRAAYDRLKKEDVEAILAGSLRGLRKQLYEAGFRRGIGDGIVLTSNDCVHTQSAS